MAAAGIAFGTWLGKNAAMAGFAALADPNDMVMRASADVVWGKTMKRVNLQYNSCANLVREQVGSLLLQAAAAESTEGNRDEQVMELVERNWDRTNPQARLDFEFTVFMLSTKGAGIATAMALAPRFIRETFHAKAGVGMKDVPLRDTNWPRDMPGMAPTHVYTKVSGENVYGSICVLGMSSEEVYKEFAVSKPGSAANIFVRLVNMQDIMDKHKDLDKRIEERSKRNPTGWAECSRNFLSGSYALTEIVAAKKILSTKGIATDACNVYFLSDRTDTVRYVETNTRSVKQVSTPRVSKDDVRNAMQAISKETYAKLQSQLREIKASASCGTFSDLTLGTPSTSRAMFKRFPTWESFGPVVLHPNAGNQAFERNAAKKLKRYGLAESVVFCSNALFGEPADINEFSQHCEALSVSLSAGLLDALSAAASLTDDQQILYNAMTRATRHLRNTKLAIDAVSGYFDPDSFARKSGWYAYFQDLFMGKRIEQMLNSAEKEIVAAKTTITMELAAVAASKMAEPDPLVGWAGRHMSNNNTFSPETGSAGTRTAMPKAFAESFGTRLLSSLITTNTKFYLGP